MTHSKQDAEDSWSVKVIAARNRNNEVYNCNYSYGNVYVNTALEGEPPRQVVYPKWSTVSYSVEQFQPPKIGKLSTLEFI